MMTYTRIDRGNTSVRELSERTGLSPATVARHTSRPRGEWLATQAAGREAIRAYHDDEGYSWAQTAKHFKLSVSTVRGRAKRARRERAAEAEERVKGPTLF